MQEGVQFISSAGEDEHRSGVGFVINDKAHEALTGYNPVDNRIVTASFKTMKGNMLVCPVYAPTDDFSKEAIDMFYSKLQTVLNSANHADIVVVMGDFNAKVGKGSGIQGGVVGEFGL